MVIYDSFPEPIGSYTVGRTQMDFTYTASDKSERELTAFFFYPSDSNEGKPIAEYADPDLNKPRLELLSTMKGAIVEPLFPPGFKIWCYDDIALSGKEEKYPVLFYSHGASASPQLGTLFCQDLASVGYIVVAVGHLGSGVYKLTDGRLIRYTPDFTNDIMEFMKMATAAFMAEPSAMTEKLEWGRALEFSRDYASAPETVKFSRHAVLQREDISHIADRLYDINEGDNDTVFKGRLKLEIGMGVFGHSFGGTTAAVVCRDDLRFVCGINFDGDMKGTYNSVISKPFMQLSTALAYNTNAHFLETAGEDSCVVIVDNVHHGDFGDSLFTGKVEAFRGSRDAMETRDLIISYTKAFFDRYLLKEPTDLGDLKFTGVEVIKTPAAQ